MFALVIDNKVVAVNNCGFESAINGDSFEFESVEVGQECINGVLSCNAISKCKLDLSTIRKKKQAGGVTVDGIELQTDEKSRFEMAQYVLESVTNGLIDVDWKKADGTSHVYLVQEFKPVYNVIVKYVGDCFKRESYLRGELEIAQDPSTVDLTAGWPSTTLTTI